MTSAPTETIQVGALSVRFLVEAADSNGSASVFECFVPADGKMPVPHSHDAFEGMDDDFVFVTAVEMPDGGTYRGQEARDWILAYVASFDD